MNILNFFKRKRPKNSIFTIVAYRHNGTWCFTDESVGLSHEPFVAGADTLCEYLASGKDKVALTFSEHKFPTSQFSLHYVDGAVSAGTTYYCPMTDKGLWLCPALGKYFKTTPFDLYINYKPLN